MFELCCKWETVVCPVLPLSLHHCQSTLIHVYLDTI